MKTLHLLLAALILALILLAYIPYLTKQLQQRITGKQTKPNARKPRILKPKTNRDCPCCQAQSAGGKTPEIICPEHIIPWNMRKGTGGRKKTIHTQGYFCSNPRCYYYLLDDGHIHALVGYGSHGKHETIPDLRCQFCHKKFTVRRHTVLYRLKTLSATVGIVLHLLAVGMDISAVEEVFNIRELTLRTWLARGGAHGQKLHQRSFANLELAHVQLDELWAKVKQSEQDVWLWTACDANHKIIPVIPLGPRTQNMAYSIVHELKSKLKPGCVPVLVRMG